ncbi:NUDIX hydrolase [Oceanibacterium hippocampi]|uniref:NUDIX domain protein n=1 Tax=Oceanibacterium hippocampi TaxID=745714 RepID=A0A1Y5RH89_9PROT|nr:NUDIX domain-containing protein [Oceanibacterium hippocampi]SLN14803.1 NUDIX domain protein [Oceanibacterium hippocampi]
MSEKKAPPVPIPSATVLLLRDGPAGLEVFMVVRHREIDFASGALVFPGGKVDPEDCDGRLTDRCPGCEGLDATARAVRVAAIREAFEECGVLLARKRGAAALVGGDMLTALEARYRAALVANTTDMATVAAAEDLELATDLLAPFAHWITPKPLPKRFDTMFFLARAPEDQLAVHDGSESVDSVWARPLDVLADWEAKRRTLVFATRMNVAKLGRAASVDAAFEQAASAPLVTVEPTMEMREDGERWLTIPAAADYGLTEERASRAIG